MDAMEKVDGFYRSERDKYKSKFLGFTLDLSKAAGQQGVDIAAKLIGAKAEIFDVNRPSAKQRIADGLSRRSKLISDHTAVVIKRELGDALDKQQSIQDIRDRLTSKYAEMSEGRAENIARTEVGLASSGAEVEGYRQMEVERKEWIAELDDRVRDSHAEADGQIVGIDEMFIVGGDQMEAPLMGSDPAEVCNCRCSVAPVAGD